MIKMKTVASTRTADLATIALLLIQLVLCQGHGSTFDPCKPGNYREMNDKRRSTGYVTNSSSPVLCDTGLTSDWYRFTSEAGGIMAISCPGRLRCGSVSPVWMKGKLPAVAEGIVTRQACTWLLSTSSNYCDESWNIQVKNCANYYVYFLSSTPTCPVAYCAGNKVQCPDGHWASPGQCRDQQSILTNSPILIAPSIYKRLLSPLCKIINPHHKPHQRYQVEWTFNNQLDLELTPSNLANPRGHVTLPLKALLRHLNTYVQCRVRTFYTYSTWHKSDFYYSKAYYADAKTIEFLIKCIRPEPETTKIPQTSWTSQTGITSQQSEKTTLSSSRMMTAVTSQQTEKTTLSSTQTTIIFPRPN